MKRQYITPLIQICKTQMQYSLMAGSINGVDGNGDLDLGGGSDEPSHSKEWEAWEE